MKRVLTSLAAALALAVPALAQVAQIGDTTYADFNSFFTAFQAIAPSETPTTVTLLDDLTGDLAVPGTVPVKEGQAIVFDLNGRTMETALQREGRHYYAIDNYGTLTIKDSSAGQTGTIRARGVQNLGNGKLAIEGGTIVSVDANGGACVWNEADAWVIRNEGDLAAFRDKVNGNVTFAGCTVTLAANLDLAGVAWIPIGEGNAGGASKNGGFFAGTSLDDASGLEVVPVLPEGMDEPDDFVVTLEDGLFYCDLLYLAERVAGESEGVTFDANAQQALLNAAGGSMHGNIAVSGRTAVDKPLTTAQVNEALACFEGTGLIVVEGALEGEKTLVVAYDFGITDVRVTGTGDLVVEVAAQDMSGRPLAFAEGATLSLRNGETALETTQATVEGVTTLTVPAANVPAGELISKCVSSTHGPREDIVPRGFSYTLCPPKLSPDGTGGADFTCGMGGGRGIMVMIFQSKEEP